MTFRNDRQRYVEVPYAGHSVLHTSAWAGEGTCGMRLVSGFFESPAAAVNTTCVDQIEALDFRGSAAMAQQLLGTEDLWENGAAMGNRLQLLLTPAQDRALETLRRQLLEPPRF